MKTEKEYIELAQKRSGSKNISFRWAKSWLLDHTKHSLCDGLRFSRDEQRNYLEAEVVRQSHPDAKRARADKHYRALWLRRQNSAIARLMNPPLGTLDQITAAQDSRKGRIAKIAEICVEKSIALGKEVTTPEVPNITAGVRISGFSADFARKMGVKNIIMVGSRKG